MEGPRTTRIFRFGPFEADPSTGALHKHGSRIKLHSQPFQVLLMLLDKPSELVTRDHLRHRLWPENTFVDFDHGLNTAVNKLRQALGDSASHPRHIETIPGKGYRFISPVTAPEPAPELAEPPSAPLETPLPVPATSLLTVPEELPKASRRLIRFLLLLLQLMYLAFYLGALANLQEIHQIFAEAQMPASQTILIFLVATAAVMIPIRLFLAAAIAFDYQHLWAKFTRLFPLLLVVDVLWALSPFLLIHHTTIGLALGLTAALVYAPFAQRSLILMYLSPSQRP